MSTPVDAPGGDSHKPDEEFTRFKSPEWLEDTRQIGGELPGEVGSFRIERRLGEGGMGAVFVASQSSPVRRLVAIKIIKRTLDSPEARHRLDVECQSLAKFNHPNIARFIDCGYCERIPFIVLEFVEGGEDIVRYCAGKEDDRSAVRKKALGLRARIELFLQACDALTHAHHRGVIHRDVSSKNVLVMELDGQPLVKIIDFGISILMEHQREAIEFGRALTDRDSAPMGTLGYMSPEQIERPSAALDPRSDVYSMGVLLFELVTGDRPYSVATEEQLRTTYNSIRQLGHPIAPSARVREKTRTLDSNDSEARSQLRVLTRLRSELRGDLDSIVIKAMQLDPNERYGSMTELAADLRRFLRGFPVEVGRPPTLSQRVQKFFRRNWIACTAASAAILFLITLAWKSHSDADTLALRNRELRKAKNAAEDRGGELETMYGNLKTFESATYAARIRGVPDFLHNGEIGSVRQVIFDAALSAEGSATSWNWEWNHLLGRVESSELVLGLSRPGFVQVLDADSAICGIAADGSVWFWKSGTGDVVGTRRLHQAPIIAAQGGPGRCLTLDESGLLIHWNADDGSFKSPVKTGVRAQAAAFSPDAKLMCVHRHGEAVLNVFSTSQSFDEKPRQTLSIPADSRNVQLVWNRDRLVSIGGQTPASNNKTRDVAWIREWKPDATGAALTESKMPVELRIGDVRLPSPSSFSHAGGRYLLQYSIGAILFRLTDEGRLDGDSFQSLRGVGEWLESACLSPDGKLVATGGTEKDRSIRLWDAETGQFQGRLAGDPDDFGAMMGHDGTIGHLTFTANSRWILSASSDGTIRKWTAAAPRYARLLQPEVVENDSEQERAMSWVRFVNRNSGLELLGVFSRFPWLAIWNAETGEPSFEAARRSNRGDKRPDFLPQGTAPVFASASQDGAVIAVIREDLKEHRYDLIVGGPDALRDDSPTPVDSFTVPVTELAVSNNGQWIAVSSGETDGQIRLWKWRGGRPDGTPISLKNSAHCQDALAFSEDSGTLAAGAIREVRLWELSRPDDSPRIIPWPHESISSLAFSADGKRLAAGSKQIVLDPKVNEDVAPLGLSILDLEKGTIAVSTDFASGQVSLIHSLAWDPSGVRIATADQDRTVRIWSIADKCRIVLTLKDAPGFLDSVAWSDNGEWLATGCPFEGAFLYRGASRKEREAAFFLREIQRKHPLSWELAADWERFPKRHRFDNQPNEFLKHFRDDPGAVEAWAWKLLMPVDDRETEQQIDHEKEKVPPVWKAVLMRLEVAASQWSSDPDLILALGIAQYRCRNWKEAAESLDRFGTMRKTIRRSNPESVESPRNARDIVGLIYLALSRARMQNESAARQTWKEARAALTQYERLQGQTLESDSTRDVDALKLAEKEARRAFGESPGE